MGVGGVLGVLLSYKITRGINLVMGAPKGPLYEQIKPVLNCRKSQNAICRVQIAFISGDHPEGALWTKAGHLGPSSDLFRGQKAR